MMPYRVNVELKDGAVCQMAKKAFNVFLSLDKVARFKRSNGWIDVEKDAMRDSNRESDYPLFADRRNTG
ncbi:MAG: hypothetical protein OET55_01625 [Desulfuromonadales bacterium]|nr:hypothetical protein [Desulfuromonadales bacterium]MDH3959952.1 hypothetical protein [Desulfuromonadales bacterium]MDH4026687.1 hypothetical protein [Desulfuromonadales bacterium]